MIPNGINDQLAQLVEHLPFKERVLGSSPRLVTKKYRISYDTFLVLHYIVILRSIFIHPDAGIGRQAWLRAMCPLGRVGSTPIPGTFFFYPIKFIKFCMTIALKNFISASTNPI